jgi:hypothetical protein
MRPRAQAKPPDRTGGEASPEKVQGGGSPDPTAPGLMEGEKLQSVFRKSTAVSLL